jgi:hypothetical protein
MRARHTSLQPPAFAETQKCAHTSPQKNRCATCRISLVDAANHVLSFTARYHRDVVFFSQAFRFLVAAMHGRCLSIFLSSPPASHAPMLDAGSRSEGVHVRNP